MLVDVDNFILINLNEKNTIVRVKRIKGESLIVVLNTKDQTEGTTFKISSHDVICNLGIEPQEGTVYGVKTDVYRKTIYLKPWGPLHFYREINEIEEEKFVRALKRIAKTLKDYNLDYRLPIELEIRPKKGTIGGTYYHKADDTDVMTFHPVSMIQLPYVGWHETAHHIWFRHMSESQKADWIKLYHTAVAVSEISTKELTEIRRDLVKLGDVFTFKKEFEDKSKISAIFKQIKTIHRLREKELDLLLKEGSKLREYWPSMAIETGSQDLHVSKYGQRSVEEYFAESLSFHLTEQIIPEAVQNLVKDTLNLFMGENTTSSKKKKAA